MQSWTNKGIHELMSQATNFETDTIKAMLLTSNYNLNTKQGAIFLSDITAISGVEPTTTGYARVTLGTKSVTLDNTNNLVNFNAANFSYTITGTLTFRYMAIYRDTGVAGTSPVLAVIDKGADQTRTGTGLSVSITFTNGIALQFDNNLASSFWTNDGLQKLLDQTINWNSATIKALALLDTYSLNTRQGVDFVSDLTPFEVTGVSGYSRPTLGTKSIVNNNSVDTIEFKAAFFTWTIPGTINFRYIALVKDTGSDATSPVLAVIDKGSLQSKTNTDVTISQDSNNWLTVTNP